MPSHQKYDLSDHHTRSTICNSCVRNLASQIHALDQLDQRYDSPRRADVPTLDEVRLGGADAVGVLFAAALQEYDLRQGAVEHGAEVLISVSVGCCEVWVRAQERRGCWDVQIRLISAVRYRVVLGWDDDGENGGEAR